MIFARKMPEFHIIIAWQKFFSPNFRGRGGEHAPRPSPVSYAYALGLYQSYRLNFDEYANKTITETDRNLRPACRI